MMSNCQYPTAIRAADRSAGKRILRRPAISRAMPPMRLNRSESVLVDVLAELKGIVLCGEGFDIELLDRDVGRCEALAQRLEERVIALEVVQGLLEALRQAVGADRLPLFVAEVVRVDGHRWRKGQLSLDAVESGGDDAPERDVRVGAGVGRLQLDVGRLGLVALEGRGDAHGAFAIVGTPGAIGRG